MYILHCPCHEAMELVSDVLFGSGRLPCWYAGGMRSIALSWLMMLSGIQDSEGSGIGESLAEMGWVVHWVVCWVACWHEMKVMWSRSLYLSSRNSNILLRGFPNIGQSYIRDASYVSDDQ